MRKSNSIGERIRATREERSMSQSDLAKLAGVTPTAVWNWETNGVVPRSETLLAVAKLLGVSKDYLLTGQPQAPQKTSTGVAVDDLSLETLINAIAAKGFEVTIRPKSD